MRGGDGQPWRPAQDGLLIRVRVTPRSSREGIDGIEHTTEGPALKVRVRALPEAGAANAAVAALVADWLEVPKRSVALASGGKSRIKTLAVAGDASALAGRLAELVGALAQKEG